MSVEMFIFLFPSPPSPHHLPETRLCAKLMSTFPVWKKSCHHDWATTTAAAEASAAACILASLG